MARLPLLFLSLLKTSFDLGESQRQKLRLKMLESHTRAFHFGRLKGAVSDDCNQLVKLGPSACKLGPLRRKKGGVKEV